MSSKELRRLRLRVAAFVLATVTALVVMTLVLGQSKGVLQRNITLYTAFENVAGLVRGTQVRLAGVNIGIVSAIRFSDDPKARRVYVDLAVREKYVHLIREDSMAMMSSKGLLGDNVVDLTLGTAGHRALAPGEFIKSVEQPNLTSTLDQVNHALAKLERFVGSADEGLRSVVTPEFGANMGRISRSTAELLETAQRGDGLAHDLLYDSSLSRDARLVVRDSRAVAAKLAQAAGELQEVVARVRHGDGMLHGMIYAGNGGRAMKDLESTMADLSDVAAQVREGNGIAHTLIYEDDATNLIQDLGEAARVVRRLAVQTEQGKGTVGGLLKDPTVYEDLTQVVNNVKRNTLLKALIRFTIRNNNLKREAAMRAKSEPTVEPPQAAPPAQPSALEQPDPTHVPAE